MVDMLANLRLSTQRLIVNRFNNVEIMGGKNVQFMSMEDVSRGGALGKDLGPSTFKRT